MPWEVIQMSEVRRCFVDTILQTRCSVARACRDYGISRKTGYKWLGRYQADPARPLADRSRRPHHSPRRTAAQVEEQLVAAHQDWGWGARKVRKLVQDQGLAVPSVNTVQAVLARRGCVGPRTQPPAPPPRRFERDEPNDLWQMDFKGPLEIARRPLHTLTVLDDHSRFLLLLELCPDHTHAALWDKLWDCFGEFGLPRQLLCDNEFSTRRQVPRTLTWLEANLLRLGIQPLHGRPYHPQTQGKVENVHGSYERELLPHARRDSVAHFQEDARRYRHDFNTRRPHEGLGLATPLTRWKPSPRRRPATLPPVVYPAGAVLRKVSTVGDIHWHDYRIKASQGLVGQYVQVRDLDEGLAVYYAHYRLRLIDKAALVKGRML
jgi:transposase InsO family protein